MPSHFKANSKWPASVSRLSSTLVAGDLESRQTGILGKTFTATEKPVAEGVQGERALTIRKQAHLRALVAGRPGQWL
jgi:hypothetical protein